MQWCFAVNPAAQVALVINPNPKSADDLYATVYVVNQTQKEIVVKAKASFMQTVDEDTGESAYSGFEKECTIKPNSQLRVGEILQWERDSSLYMDVEIKNERYVFDLKGFRTVQTINALGECLIFEGKLLAKE